MSDIKSVVQNLRKANQLRRSAGYIALLHRLTELAYENYEKKARHQRRNDDALPYDRKCRIGAVERPHYGYCMFHAGILAERLGHDSVSVCEFGVAGGNGLLNLEKHAAQIEKELDVTFEIYGFDTGEGLPEPQGYRDFPFKWHEGDYEMDQKKLDSKLGRAELVIDDIDSSAEYFTDQYDPAPIGAIMFDLDYYSSTINSFKIFDNRDEFFLPRVVSYFDDVAGGMLSQSNKYVGELRAIDEFNENHDDEKIAKIYFTQNLSRNRHILPDRLYTYQRFDHEEYNNTIRKLSDNMGL